MTPKSLLILLALIIMYVPCLSQDNPTALDKITNFPTQFLNKVNQKTADLESKLDRQTEKYLQRLLKAEKKLRKKLQKTDSAAAGKLADSEQQYEQFSNLLRQNAPSPGGQSSQYIPYLDTLKTSLSFLDKNSDILSNSKDIGEKVRGSLQHVKELQSKLQQTEQVKAFIRQRREYIKQALGQFTKLPKGLSRTYTDFNKEYYYYTQQVKEYKELLNNPDQLTRKAITALSRLNSFQQFMQKHSELAALFGLPADYGTPQALAGLQTRVQVQQLIQTQISGAGPNAQQMLQQNLQAAQQQLNTLKDKVNKLGGGGSGDIDMDMPDFKPDNQKTKNFLQRLEIGTNIQSVKSNFYFPTTTDLGLSVGYKLSDKSTIGIGGSYKIGWGQDIRHIVITSEGAGVRSFLDVKLKGSFFLSGGYEYNYQPAVISLNNQDPLQARWTESGLVGVSKILSLKTKFFKKTKMQLLWDFLSYQQEPRTQSIKFRVGYNF
jgi:hypothetical protein